MAIILSHRIHGTGIFTYVHFTFYGICRKVLHTLILWGCLLLPEKNKNKRTQTIKHIVKNNNNDYLYESIASNLAVDEDGAADTDAAASAAADDEDADADADAEENDADDAAANHDDDHHRLVRKAAIKNTTI